MKVEKGNVVVMHYQLKNDDGQILDTSFGKDPLGFIHGNGMIIAGLEYVMLGKTAGDRFTAVIPPEDAYGEKKDEYIQDVPLSQFGNPSAVKKGAKFQLNGQYQPAVVLDVKDDVVTLDMNHPLADQTLHFEIELVEVREATSEERESGRVVGIANQKG
ncbi:peptidylprolyl isomerase [Candidatus Marinamargulisbacteria bacterium SCGC AG-414-C22]|nr:peptidylprolyl isomerase [Candidatus Marinamargulisbacteria bacterium SCGC AG-414-C22]